MKNVLSISLVILCLAAMQVSVYAQKESTPEFEIVHFTDIHLRTQFNSFERFVQTVDQVKNRYPGVDFAINTGDLVDNPDRSRLHVDSLWTLWQQSKKALAPLKMYSCLGNHDPYLNKKEKDSSYYGKGYAMKHLGMPARYYTFTKGNWLFVALDACNNSDAAAAEQREWLSQQLQLNRGKRNVLLFLHAPIVSPGAAYNGGYIDNEKSVVDTLANYKEVKCVLSGHTHINDQAYLKGVRYYNGGSVSGYWWEKGPQGDGAYRGSKAGYGILKLYKNGDSSYEFIEHGK